MADSHTIRFGPAAKFGREALLVSLSLPFGSLGWAGLENLMGETAGKPDELRAMRRL